MIYPDDQGGWPSDPKLSPIENVIFVLLVIGALIVFPLYLLSLFF